MTANSTRKITIESVSGPISGCWPSVVEPEREAADGAVLDQDAGDAAIADQPRQRHRQRRQADIGDPEAVDQPGQHARRRAPAAIPAASARPCWNSHAITQADSPMTEATERSISPLMMISVIISATMIFSIDSWNRLTMLPTPR